MSVCWSVRLCVCLLGHLLVCNDQVKKLKNAYFRPCPPIRDLYWPYIQPCYPSWAIFGYPWLHRALKSGKILVENEFSWFLVPYSMIKNLCFDLLGTERKIYITWLVRPIFQCCDSSKRPISFLHDEMQLLDFGQGSGRLNA